jgi:hypothetical protein
MTTNSRPMTLDDIDRALADWQERLARVDENLIELDGEPTCELLEKSELEGITKERVTPALAAMRELFAQRTALNNVLDRARALRASTPRHWPSPRGLAEIEQLLRGPSIKLPPVRTPLAQRGLLTAAQREDAICPEDLLAAMTQAFEVARDAVLAVDAAWTRLNPGLEDAERQVEALERRARSLGAEAGPELAGARGQIEALRRRVSRDPLGTAEGFEGSLTPLLANVRARLDALVAERDQLQRDRDRARRLCQELREAHRAFVEAQARYRREILDPPAAPSPPEDAAIEGLASWLETLEATLNAGHVQAARVGLSRWLDSAEGYLAQERAARTALDGALAAREELLGRLSARRAQVDSLGRRGLPQAPELEATAQALEALLLRLPAPLAEATRRVAEFEAQLAKAQRPGAQ